MESERRCIHRWADSCLTDCYDLRDFTRPASCLSVCVDIALRHCGFWARVRLWMGRRK